MKPVAAWFVSFVFFLNSCGITMVVAPKYLDVPLDYAVKYPLLPDSARVLFISRVDFGKPGLNEKKLKTIRAGAYTALKYASEQLNQAQQIKVIGLPDSATMPLSTDSVKSLAATYHSDYILALTDFHAEVALNSMDDANAYYDSSVDVNFTLYKGDGTYYKD